MAVLTSADLFELEAMVRLHADRQRKDWPDNPADPLEVQAHARFVREEADAFDQVGDLLRALGRDWPGIRPMLAAAAKKEKFQ